MRTLTELGPHLGFAVTIIPEVTLGERDVNSTRIRELLEAGEVGAQPRICSGARTACAARSRRATSAGARSASRR